MQFLNIVEKQKNAWSSNNELKLESEVLLFLMKLTKKVSFGFLDTLFQVAENTAINVFNRHAVQYFSHNVNLKMLVNLDGSVNQSEIDSMLEDAYERTPPFFKKLLEDFEDPSGNGRIPVCIQTDGTYIGITNSTYLKKNFSYLFYH